MTTQQIIERCPICGGNAGTIPVGGHYACQEKQKRGLPCESLGEKCQACNGTGTPRRHIPAGVMLPLNPSGKSLKLWFPKCEHCDGKGYRKP